VPLRSDVVLVALVVVSLVAVEASLAAVEALLAVADQCATNVVDPTTLLATARLRP
jgi:hypothetical protein